MQRRMQVINFFYPFFFYKRYIVGPLLAQLNPACTQLVDAEERSVVDAKEGSPPCNARMQGDVAS